MLVLFAMEIAILKNNSLKIKGKNAVISIDPQEKIEANASLVFAKTLPEINSDGSEIVINGPGEYEVGGIKISAQRQDADLVYNVNVDSVTILLGKVSTLSRIHTKLKESQILIVNSDNATDASFLTSLVTNVIIFYGDNSVDVAKLYGQENVTKVSKYATTIDKLPAEIETFILE